MPDTVKFGELLGTYRTRCGWSQEELARKSGVSRNAIVLWERTERGRQANTHPHSRGVVLRLADALQLSKEERKEFLEAAGFSIEHWPADYWNVPYPRNPFFVGRETILDSLRQRLVPGARTTALTQSISGLGGIGKTQVAVEYAHRYGEHYEAVLWIQADSHEVATAAYLQLATQVLELPEQQEAEQQIAEVKRWLQKRHGWLLILDNVEDPQSILTAFVPSKHQGSVLITTRMREAGPQAQSEVLPMLSRYEGVLFLLRRARKIGQEASIRHAMRNDLRLAKDLYRWMDGLPLALDQAGAYIAETGSSFQRYCDLYQQFLPKLLDHRQAPTDHPASVRKTFEISWQAIGGRNPLAGKALRFCAFLAPEQIPEQLVLAGVAESEKTWDELEMDEALGLLHRYSLVERADETLSLHRLVQEVLQEVLPEEERQHWMKQAILVVNAVFPSGEHGTWPVCEFLLPHALTCARWIPVLKQKNLESASLLVDTGRYLYERAQYRDAEPLYQRALAICEQQSGASHPDTATSLNFLALLYESQGRYQEAEPLYQRALAIYEQQLGAEHPNTAQSLNSLAGLYHQQERYAEAEPLYQRAVQISFASLGMEHSQTRLILMNHLTLLAQIHTNGDLEALLQLLRQEEQSDHRE